MFTIHHLTLNVYVGSVQESRDILQALQSMGQKVDQIMKTEADFKAVLDKIDTVTTHIADNVQVISDTTSTIGTEVDALVAAMQAAGVSDAIVQQAQGISEKLTLTSDAADAQIVALKAIAAKGAPTVPPPPPAVVLA